MKSQSLLSLIIIAIVSINFSCTKNSLFSNNIPEPLINKWAVESANARLNWTKYVPLESEDVLFYTEFFANGKLVQSPAVFGCLTGVNMEHFNEDNTIDGTYKVNYVGDEIQLEIKMPDYTQKYILIRVDDEELILEPKI